MQNVHVFIKKQQQTSKRGARGYLRAVKVHPAIHRGLFKVDTCMLFFEIQGARFIPSGTRKPYAFQTRRTLP